MNDLSTLREAKDHLNENFESGTKCPCCQQTVKLYKRKLRALHIQALVTMYRFSNREYVHVQDFLTQHSPEGHAQRGGEYAQLRYWDLITPLEDRREDGGSVGYWKITQKGIDFLEGRIRVKAVVKLYNNGVFGFGGDDITPQDALKEKFNFNELMGI